MIPLFAKVRAAHLGFSFFKKKSADVDIPTKIIYNDIV